MSVSPLPASLVGSQLTVGVHRRHIKGLVFGGPGTGKGFFLSSVPGRYVLLDTGEDGTALYMPEGRKVAAINVDTAPKYMDAMEWCLRNAGGIDAVLADGVNHAWEDWMDYWAAKLGHDLQMQDWRLVKGPWKDLHWRLMRAPFHLFYTCHLKDISFEKPAGGGAAEVKQVEVAQIEKSLPYLFDLILQAEKELDAKKKPTGWHRYTVIKCRRPLSVPPDKLFTGQFFRSHEKTPIDPWKQIIEPLLPFWSDGAVDVLGTDPAVEQGERAEMARAASAQVLDHILTVIESQTTLEGARAAFEREILPALPNLTPAHKARVEQAIKTAKVRLGGTEKK